MKITKQNKYKPDKYVKPSAETALKTLQSRDQIAPTQKPHLVLYDMQMLTTECSVHDLQFNFITSVHYLYLKVIQTNF